MIYDFWEKVWPCFSYVFFKDRRLVYCGIEIYGIIVC